MGALCSGFFQSKSLDIQWIESNERVSLLSRRQISHIRTAWSQRDAHFNLYFYSEIFPLHFISPSQNFFMHHLFTKTKNYSGFQRTTDGQVLQHHCDFVVSFMDDLITVLHDGLAVSKLVENMFRSHLEYDVSISLYRDLLQALDRCLLADDGIRFYAGYRGRSFRKLLRLIDSEIQNIYAAEHGTCRRLSVWSLTTASSDSDKSSFYSRLSANTKTKWSSHKKVLKTNIIATPVVKHAEPGQHQHAKKDKNARFDRGKAGNTPPTSVFVRKSSENEGASAKHPPHHRTTDMLILGSDRSGGKKKSVFHPEEDCSEPNDLGIHYDDKYI